ncbi:hemolysin family protein [Salinicoccus halitifaciens]|uniref:Mg2+/Co2+ transporter CorB n=1 Tax=Salinicoccus halitifaciens TaxID=1073415 RepID=A0ABV2EB31_9STAP|nr:CNNM domain-containing protein [Salinicoccus halitifaciens]
MTVLFIAIILLFIASSYFSGSETALTATNEMKLQMKARSGDKKSERLLKLVNNPTIFIPGILIANNLPNIVLPSLVTIVAIEYGWNIGITTAILTVLIIIFAEVLPKSVAAAFPERISHIVYYPTMAILFVLRPFIFLLNLITKTTIKLLGKDDGRELTISRSDMRAMVDIGHTEGTFENDEVYSLKGVLDFPDLNVADILQTPRTEVDALSAHISYEDAKKVMLHSRYSRYPVYDGDLDNMIGVFHTKFFVAWSDQTEKAITDFSDLDPLTIYEFQPVDVVFKRMLQENKHLAIVLDEYGGTEGILTHEELIETMIGREIRDETDVDGVMVKKHTDDEIICDSKIPLHQLNNMLDGDIPDEDDNLAGFILGELGYLPETGETLETEGLVFEILEVGDRRIHTVKITRQLVETGSHSK